MLETHPFGVFVPKNAKYLLLGSFTAKAKAGDDSYDWFYGTKRNQFWQILREVYKLDLKSKREKQELFTRLGIAITDIIYQCERREGNNLDNNLTNIVYHVAPIEKIFKKNKIRKVLFSSRFVETKFKQNFKNIIKKFSEVEFVTLPSPSPRYAAMARSEKIKKYRALLPKSQS